MVSEQEFIEGMYLSLAIGLYYTFNAFMPILAWYGRRKYDILAMPNNIFYKLSWYLFFALHFFAFSPMAFLWPATYIGSGLILDFYDLANFYMGTVGAFAIYLFVGLLWLISMLFYGSNDVVSRLGMFEEMVMYFALEALAWTYTVKLYPVAHTNFYYANETWNMNNNGRIVRPFVEPDEAQDAIDSQGAEGNNNLIIAF